MPLALLLSPDDQAVSAITAVLEEMAVTCERPLDGVSAAKQLSAHNFDLVLVDCENLPAAKLIFDICRRGKSGNNPVLIAIVDGRAGLPTAFRLGAELILTKPVAKDQARGTIRTVVSRMKKEDPSRPAQTAAPISAGESDAGQTCALQTDTVQTEALLTYDETSTELAGNTTPEPRALAATAAAGSSPGSPVPQSSAASAPGPAASAPSAAPAFDASSATKTAPTPAEPRPSAPMKPSDDPVLAEAENANAVPQAPICSSDPQKQRKTRGSLVAVLVVALAAGGVYTAWMYQPGFRALVQPQVDSLWALVVTMRQSHAAARAPAGERTATRPAPAGQAASSANSSQVSQSAAASASDTVPSTLSDATTSSSNPAAAMPLSSGSAAPLAQPATATSAAWSGLGKSGAAASGAGKLGANPDAANQSGAAAGSSPTHGTLDAELPGEQTAVILSSKGAERRLVHSVQPTYPAEARSNGAEGTVVLKAVIDENGRIAGVRIIEGDATLARAAISAVKQWRYHPYIRDGKARAFQTVVLVDFQQP